MSTTTLNRIDYVLTGRGFITDGHILEPRFGRFLELVIPGSRRWTAPHGGRGLMTRLVCTQDLNSGQDAVEVLHTDWIGGQDVRELADKTVAVWHGVTTSILVGCREVWITGLFDENEVVRFGRDVPRPRPLPPPPGPAPTPNVIASGTLGALKSGGPSMTVVHIDGQTCACKWFGDPTLPVRSGSFPVEALRLVRDH